MDGDEPVWERMRCMPQDVALSQPIDIVKRWLELYPEKRHWNAAHIVAVALSEAFPCE